jgi:hypothetical protein
VSSVMMERGGVHSKDGVTKAAQGGMNSQRDGTSGIVNREFGGRRQVVSSEQSCSLKAISVNMVV